MKNLKYLVVLIIGTFLFTDCGDSVSTGASNKYIGSLPGIAEAHKNKIDKLESDAKNATKMDEAFEINQKIKLAKEEVEKLVKEETAKLPLPIAVPYEGEIKIDKYEVNDFKITNCLYNTIEFTATITPKVTREYLFAYVHLVDAKGNILESPKDWAVFAVSNFRDVKEGEQIEMKGYFRGLEKLENFEKAVFKTKEEYDKK